ncbi:MAG: hypothetical protein C4547_15015 [Phycisphaerales bacterium]|nr:MAG: hypothetical protein C4547_15015 [Phycisphaerales bacterium]
MIAASALAGRRVSDSGRTHAEGVRPGAVPDCPTTEAGRWFLTLAAAGTAPAAIGDGVMRSRYLRMIGLTGLALSAGVAAGCADKLTYERFGMLSRGTSDKTDAELTLGEPNTKLPDQWIWERPDKGLTAWIEFGPDGKIKSKRWVDAERNQIEIDDPDTGPADGSTTSTTIRTRRDP